MDEIINLVLGIISDNEVDMQNTLRRLENSREVIVARRDEVDTVLFERLNPSQHTLPFIFLLSVKVSIPVTNHALYFRQFNSLLESPSIPQIRYVPQKFIQLCEVFADLSIKHNQCEEAIQPLKRAICLLQTVPEEVTSIHSLYLRACLLSKQYQEADNFLKQDVFTTRLNSITASTFLLFCFYGGLIQAGLKHYPEALDMFQCACCVPAQALSAIMVESYKKYVLVSLLLRGSLERLPKVSNTSVARRLPVICGLYTELAKIYEMHDVLHLTNFIEENKTTLQKDKNYGLAKQTIVSLRERKILRQTQCFVTLSLEDIAQEAQLHSPKEAEKMLLRMVEDGKLYATIDQKAGMVAFKDDPEQYDDNTMRDMLLLQVNRTMELNGRLENINNMILSSDDYIKKSLRKRLPQTDADFAVQTSGFVGN